MKSALVTELVQRIWVLGSWSKETGKGHVGSCGGREQFIKKEGGVLKMIVGPRIGKSPGLEPGTPGPRPFLMGHLQLYHIWRSGFAP